MHFGFESRTEKGSTLVGRQYTSPEQVLGEKVDARSDLYSFGVILYEMLYGGPPFKGVNIDQEHLHKTPNFEESSQRFTPSFLVNIIRKCLEKNRDLRYQTAMEIIDELEPTRRGPYAGAVGYFSFSGNMDTCIALRTLTVKGKTAYLQAGGGVVADSVPELEYEETLNKARALMRAIELARTGIE